MPYAVYMKVYYICIHDLVCTGRKKKILWRTRAEICLDAILVRHKSRML